MTNHFPPWRFCFPRLPKSSGFGCAFPQQHGKSKQDEVDHASSKKGNGLGFSLQRFWKHFGIAFKPPEMLSAYIACSQIRSWTVLWVLKVGCLVEHLSQPFLPKNGTTYYQTIKSIIQQQLIFEPKRVHIKRAIQFCPTLYNCCIPPQKKGYHIVDGPSHFLLYFGLYLLIYK